MECLEENITREKNQSLGSFVLNWLRQVNFKNFNKKACSYEKVLINKMKCWIKMKGIKRSESIFKQFSTQSSFILW